jgi:hypothetical protein
LGNAAILPATATAALRASLTPLVVVDNASRQQGASLLHNLR